MLVKPLLSIELEWLRFSLRMNHTYSGREVFTLLEISLSRVFKARKMISKGCNYHLLWARGMNSKAPLELLHFINKFSKVFLDNLPRVPPRREIKFRIDLFSRYPPYLYSFLQNGYGRTKRIEGSFKGYLR